MKNQKERLKKVKPIDLIPKEVMAVARDVVFSFPNDPYEEKLRKVNERVYKNRTLPLAINPSHTSLALDEAMKTF